MPPRIPLTARLPSIILIRQLLSGLDLSWTLKGQLCLCVFPRLFLVADCSRAGQARRTQRHPRPGGLAGAPERGTGSRVAIVAVSAAGWGCLLNSPSAFPPSTGWAQAMRRRRHRLHWPSDGQPWGLVGTTAPEALSRATPLYPPLKSKTNLRSYLESTKAGKNKPRTNLNKPELWRLMVK